MHKWGESQYSHVNANDLYLSGLGNFVLFGTDRFHNQQTPCHIIRWYRAQLIHDLTHVRPALWVAVRVPGALTLLTVV